MLQFFWTRSVARLPLAFCWLVVLPFTMPVAALDGTLDTATPVSAGQSDEQWRLDRDKDGIKIYTRTVDGSRFRAVRAVMLTSFSMPQLVALIRDTAACPEWANLCKASRVVEQRSETELFVYTHNDLPWPVSDRDAVTHVHWTVLDGGAAVQMTATAAEGHVPSVRGVTRLKDAETSWTFRRQPDGQIEVETFAHIDPGGPMPAWLINRLLLDAPHKTLLGMREVLNSGRYRDAEFGFLP